MDFTLTPPGNKKVLFGVLGFYQARCSNYCVPFQASTVVSLKRNKPTMQAQNTNSKQKNNFENKLIDFKVIHTCMWANIHLM